MNTDAAAHHMPNIKRQHVMPAIFVQHNTANDAIIFIKHKRPNTLVV